MIQFRLQRYSIDCDPDSDGWRLEHPAGMIWRNQARAKAPRQRWQGASAPAENSVTYVLILSPSGAAAFAAGNSFTPILSKTK